MAGYAKKAIRDSFVKILNKKPISQITIRDIVDDCGVNRNTFYYYFQDLPQLVETVVNEDAERIIREYPTMDSAEACVDAAIEFALKNKRAVMHIFHSASRDIYEQYQWRVCEHVVTSFLDRILKDRAVSREDRALLIRYLKSVLFGLIIGWLETGMHEDIRESFHRICELKQGELEQMIARCEEK